MALVKGTNCGFVATRPTSDPAGTSYMFDTYAYGIKDVAPVGATKITEVGWWCDNATEAADTQVGIYSHNAVGDLPSVLLGSATFAKGTMSGWKYASVDIDVVAGTTYWIGAQLDDTVTTTNINYASGTGTTAYMSGLTALPDPWGSTSKWTELDAVYAVYTTIGLPVLTGYGLIRASP